jgi:hypothetical protein
MHARGSRDAVATFHVKDQRAESSVRHVLVVNLCHENRRPKDATRNSGRPL